MASGRCVGEAANGTACRAFSRRPSITPETRLGNIDQPKWKNRVAWGAQGLLALGFLAAGSQKIIGTEPMMQMFAAIGLGPLFQYVTGSLEITGAVMLLIPATAFWGAALVSCIMVGAIYTHLAVIGGSFVPALMLLLLACIVLWVRNPGRT